MPEMRFSPCVQHGLTSSVTQLSYLGAPGIAPPADRVYQIAGGAYLLLPATMCLSGMAQHVDPTPARTPLAIHSAQARLATRFTPATPANLQDAVRSTGAVGIFVGNPYAPFGIAAFDPEIGTLTYSTTGLFGWEAPANSGPLLSGSKFIGSIPRRQWMVRAMELPTACLWLDPYTRQILISHLGLWWSMIGNQLALTSVPIGISLFKLGEFTIVAPETTT